MDTLGDNRKQKAKRVMRSLEEKRSIVEEALAQDVSVAAVARRHNVNANLLFGWRRLHEQGLLGSRIRPAALVSVRTAAMVACGEIERAGGRLRAEQPAVVSGVIEIELPNGVRMWIRGAVEATAMSAVCEALLSRCAYVGSLMLLKTRKKMN